MDIDDPRWGKEEEFVRSADGKETSHVDSEATIMNLIREGNRREAETERLRAALQLIAENHGDNVGIAERALDQSAPPYDQPMRCHWCGEVHEGGPENCNRPEAKPIDAQAGERTAREEK